MSEGVTEWVNIAGAILMTAGAGLFGYSVRGSDVSFPLLSFIIALLGVSFYVYTFSRLRIKREEYY